MRKEGKDCIGLTSSLSNACIYIDLYFGLSNACIDRDICKKLRSTYHTHSRRAKQSHMQESHIFSRARHSIPSVVVMKLLIRSILVLVHPTIALSRCVHNAQNLK